MSSLDIKARIQAIPFSEPIYAAAEEEAAVAEEVVETFEETTEETGGETGGTGGAGDSGLKWKGLQIPDISTIEPVVKVADKVVSSLEKIVNLINPILNILELFISAFNSFSAIVEALVTSAQKTVNDFAADLGNAGVFFNALVPPGLNFDLLQNKNYQRLASGGYDGFLTRLEVSLNNAADPNRPIFSNNASVGGILIMVDAESLDEFFQSVNTLNNLFSFMNFLPIVKEPVPPSNLKAVSGTFSDDPDATEGTFGVRLTWDSPSLKCPVFRVGRSLESGGTKKEEAEYIPDKLWGKDGFIRALRLRKATGKWPTKTVYEYEPVGTAIANPVTGGGEFFDDTVEEGKEYYYVVFSGYPPVYGGPSSETRVVADNTECVASGLAGVVQHVGGGLEFLGVGLGSIGQWSSIQLKGMIPFLPTLLEEMNKLFNVIKGMVKNSSSAFGDFIDGIKAKIEKYVDLIDVVTAIIDKILGLDFGTIAMLNVTPEEGGVTHFMERVRNAEPVGEGFTGPEGVTLGIVLMYGAASNSSGSTEAIEKSIGLLRNVLGID